MFTFLFAYLHLSVSNDIISTKIYDKHDDFDFESDNFQFKMVMFLFLHPTEFIFLNSSDWLEHLAMSQTSTLVINFNSETFKQALICGVYCIFVTFPCGALGHVWYLIVSFADLCRLSYFKYHKLCKTFFFNFIVEPMI